MSTILDVPFSRGYVSTGGYGKSADDLDPGELARMSGAFYRKNDSSQVWKIPGRSLFAAAGTGKVKGLAVCQFDQGGTDRLLAYTGTTISSATPGLTGTFTNLVTGLNASATTLTACHQDDRWYLGNGYDANRCLRPDGTVRLMGLTSPQAALTAVASSTSGVIAYPTANSGFFTNPTKAYDSDDTTFAGGTLSAVGSTTHTWSLWASDTTALRYLEFRWGLSGFQQGFTQDADRTIGTGGALISGYGVTVLLELSQDSGATWTALHNATHIRPIQVGWTQSATLTADSNLVQFRATLTYNRGVSPATLAIYSTRIRFGSTTANFSTTTGIYYAYTEYYDADDIEGPYSPLTSIVTLATQNQVTLTRPAAVNPAATHWNVYRIVDGATPTADNLGLLKQVPISQSTYVDTFDVDVKTQLLPIVPLMTIGDLSIPRDSPPPSFIHMMSWQGSICGISRENRRQWSYSEAGRAESFPEFYVVTAFPLDEHDGLIGQMAVGDTAVLLCEGAALAVDGLPRVVDGQFNAADARPLKGHPGCVGYNAFTTFSVAGEPRGAWVSPFGVYVTNGQVCACISTDLAWEQEVAAGSLASAVLRWDARNLILWFEFDLDGDGLNDHEMPFHMASAHEKGEFRPKLGQPTAKASSAMTSGLISASHFRFSGHPSDGSVYVEEQGYLDASTGVGVAMRIQTGRITQKETDVAVIKAMLNHTNFGAGETGTLTTTVYRDSANASNAKTNTVRLDGDRETTSLIGRAGPAVQFQLDYTGSGLGAFLEISAEIDTQGRSGSAARWSSSTATP